MITNETDVDKYLKIIEGMSAVSDGDIPKDLLKWEYLDSKGDKFECIKAPFDYCNPDPMIICLGLTPGNTQMVNAINSVIGSFASPIRADKDSIMLKAKQAASFSNGKKSKTQDNLIAILKTLGYEKKLGISNLKDLWGTHGDLVEFRSVLKYPVFVNGENYKGNPTTRNAPPRIEEMVEEFIKELTLINPNAILIPLGDAVLKVVTKLNKDKKIPQKLILKNDGKILFHPHPSGESCHYKNLLLKSIYPAKEDYQEQMYLDYTPKKGKKRQSEETHNKKMGTYWSNAKDLRDSYEIT